MRKAILPVVGIAVLATTLAGCGSSGKSTAGGLTSSPGVSSQQPAADDGSGSADGSGADSDSSASSSAGGCQPQVEVSFCEKIDITGAVTVSGTGQATAEFDQDPPNNVTCANWVSYQPQNSDFPQLELPTDAVDGHQLQMYWKFPQGAGSSDISKYAGVNYIDIDSAGFQDTAVDVNDPTASSGSMQINPDGSGTLTFTGLVGDSGKISGTVSWTCVDSQ